MALAHSRVTAQGQVSVLAKVRQRLGVGPGSVLEWDEDGDRVVVRKAGRYSSEDIHRALFTKARHRRSIDDRIPLLLMEPARCHQCGIVRVRPDGAT